mmetsp:Transcript_10090/g.42936  ORF Transcript_10090/g.42936 Transcript_10090/m.42936 type:complete len:531 (+) Transcript_10090:1020-2612(+)
MYLNRCSSRLSRASSARVARARPRPRFVPSVLLGRLLGDHLEHSLRRAPRRRRVRAPGEPGDAAAQEPGERFGLVLEVVHEPAGDEREEKQVGVRHVGHQPLDRHGGDERVRGSREEVQRQLASSSLFLDEEHRPSDDPRGVIRRPVFLPASQPSQAADGRHVAPHEGADERRGPNRRPRRRRDRRNRVPQRLRRVQHAERHQVYAQVEGETLAERVRARRERVRRAPNAPRVPVHDRAGDARQTHTRRPRLGVLPRDRVLRQVSQVDGTPVALRPHGAQRFFVDGTRAHDEVPEPRVERFRPHHVRVHHLRGGEREHQHVAVRADESFQGTAKRRGLRRRSFSESIVRHDVAVRLRQPREPRLGVLPLDPARLARRPRAVQRGLRQPRGEVAGERASLGSFQKHRAEPRRGARGERGALGGEAQAVAELTPHQVVSPRERAEEHAEAHSLFAVMHVLLAQQLLEARGVPGGVAAQQAHAAGEHRDAGADHVRQHERAPEGRAGVLRARRAFVAARARTPDSRGRPGWGR